MKNLFYRLLIYLDTASESDTNYNIALYMAHNFQKISTMGISQLSTACFVSPATISRFCRTLGYDNYAHLKQDCYVLSSYRNRLDNLINMPLKLIQEEPQKAVTKYAENICENISQLSSLLDWKVIDEVLKLIYEQDEIIMFGTQFSHSAALHLQTDLLMLEKFTVAHMDIDRQIECAKSLSSQSVVILITLNGNLFNSSNKLIQYLKKSEAKVILITSNENLVLPIDVIHTIYVGTSNMAKYAKQALLMTMELMSLRYYATYYATVKQKTYDDFMT